ncbi:DUF4230 domain-containing protein [uncultured Polaribacter sp.]|uniref:DUF4230 domain-containing protein n=1 Tax=uncultured Polaribacter sp. TaxID=174711 RepID=UPI00262A7B4F|nr:DUF4230 domain-containing protein [uncultured Polaribacter sp.]
MRFLKYIAIFLLGFLLAKFWYQKNEKPYKKEEIKVVVNAIENLSKLVVSSGTFSEVYNYSDSKKYFYDYLSFDKKAIVTVNAKVEIGYDLSQLAIELDSLDKKIIIHKIPTEEIVIAPDIKYFDIQQSSFNAFSKEELNKINEKSIANIKETIAITNLKKEAKKRFLEEISKIYQLSAIYNWQVIDNTKSSFLEHFKD